MEGEDPEPYYDFHVPVFNNYWAQGIWHHNSGKTSHLQAIIWAIWGQSIRKLAGNPSVLIEHDKGSIERTLTPSGERVSRNGSSPQQKTKILAEIEAEFGSFASWSRTLFLTGRNIGMFSQGTPSFRWDYLLKLTGAAQYDKAIAAAKLELRGASAKLETISNEFSSINFHRTNSLQRWEESNRAMSERAVVPNESLIAHMKNALQHLRELLLIGQAAETKAVAALELAEKDHTAIQLQFNSADRKVKEAMARRAVCEACGSRVPDPVVAVLEQELEVLRGQVHEARELCYRNRDRQMSIRQKLADRQSSIRGYEGQIQKEENKTEAFQQGEVQLYELFNTWLTLHRKQQSISLDLTVQQGLVMEKSKVVETLTAARQLYLSNFLAQINQTAAMYLAHIGAKAMVELVAVGDKGLELQTVGTGADSYANCSGGEQRRIDFCLALAMAEVAASMGHLTTEVPLIVDEAFDTLDEAGIGALLSLACHIAKHRQVILVSHVLPDVPLESSIVPIRLGP